MKSNIKILLVDDIEHNNYSIKSYFRRQYEIEFTNSGTVALDLMQKSTFDIIISDQKMPIMNGLKFLEKSMEIQPDAVRILISAHADNIVLKDAINLAKIFKFIPKPFENSELETAVGTAVNIVNVKREMSENIQNLLSKITLLSVENEALKLEIMALKNLSQ
jgi:response regulator RpfG family c-di-GMP phosphodiesterase